MSFGLILFTWDCTQELSSGEETLSPGCWNLETKEGRILGNLEQYFGLDRNTRSRTRLQKIFREAFSELSWFIVCKHNCCCVLEWDKAWDKLCNRRSTSEVTQSLSRVWRPEMVESFSALCLCTSLNLSWSRVIVEIRSVSWRINGRRFGRESWSWVWNRWIDDLLSSY